MFIVEEVFRKMYLDFVKENFMELLKVGVFKIIYLNLFYCRKGVNIFIYCDCWFDYILVFFFIRWVFYLMLKGYY